MNTPKSVLVVDDDTDLLFVMKLLLKRSGYAVRVLSDCTKVFEELKENQPDLIILDINLGPCLGTELCAEIKNINKYSVVPIILYSANKYPRDIHSACHADAYIEKPFSNDFLIESVKSFVGDATAV